MPVCRNVHDARFALYAAHCGAPQDPEDKTLRGSHDGRDRMEATVRSQVYFANIAKWCLAVTSACPACAQVKAGVKMPKLPPVKIVEQRVNDRVRARSVLSVVSVD